MAKHLNTLQYNIFLGVKVPNSEACQLVRFHLPLIPLGTVCQLQFTLYCCELCFGVSALCLGPCELFLGVKSEACQEVCFHLPLIPLDAVCQLRFSLYCRHCTCVVPYINIYSNCMYNVTTHASRNSR